MHCPNHKKNTKPKNLKTVRTIIEGQKVKRERVCPTCKKRFWTIELYQDNYDDEIRLLNAKVWDAENERGSIEDKIDRLKDVLKEVLDSPGE